MRVFEEDIWEEKALFCDLLQKKRTVVRSSSGSQRLSCCGDNDALYRIF